MGALWCFHVGCGVGGGAEPYRLLKGQAGKRHEKLSKALVNGTTRLDSTG